MRDRVKGLKERMQRALRTLIAAGAVATAAACTSPQPPVDVRVEHLRACEAYTSALAKVVVWKDLGAFNEGELEELRKMEAATTPLCMTETPTPDGAQLVDNATQALEDMLIRKILDERREKETW